MNDERFNELVNGPLNHPIVPLMILRLVGALRAVVEATGDDGDNALERYCANREEMDQNRT